MMTSALASSRILCAATMTLFCLRFAGSFALKSMTPEDIAGSVLDEDLNGVSRYPYLVSLRATGPGGSTHHICGGALISPQHVVASASCLVDKVVFDPEVHIGRAYPVMSEQHLNRRHAEVILAAKVHFPPGWSPVESAVLTQDIAVVELQHPSRYPPVRLPEAGFKLQQDKRLRTMGWAPSGRTNEYFMDITLAELLPQSSARNDSLTWASQKMPSSWCSAGAGRALVLKAAPGEGLPGDVLLGIQSANGLSQCSTSASPLGPRPVGFTPLDGAGGSLDWVAVLVAPSAPLKSPAVRREGNNHREGHQATQGGCGGGFEFQSLKVCEW